MLRVLLLLVLGAIAAAIFVSDVQKGFWVGVFFGAVIRRVVDVLWTVGLHLTGEIKNFPPTPKTHNRSDGHR